MQRWIDGMSVRLATRRDMCPSRREDVDVVEVDVEWIVVPVDFEIEDLIGSEANAAEEYRRK